ARGRHRLQSYHAVRRFRLTSIGADVELNHSAQRRRGAGLLRPETRSAGSKRENAPPPPVERGKRPAPPRDGKHPRTRDDEQGMQKQHGKETHRMSKPNYRVILTYDGERKMFLARAPELEHCAGEGASRAEAISRVEEEIDAQLANMPSHGTTPPRSVDEES